MTYTKVIVENLSSTPYSGRKAEGKLTVYVSSVTMIKNCGQLLLVKTGLYDGPVSSEFKCVDKALLVPVAIIILS